MSKYEAISTPEELQALTQLENKFTALETRYQYTKAIAKATEDRLKPKAWTSRIRNALIQNETFTRDKNLAAQTAKHKHAIEEEFIKVGEVNLHLEKHIDGRNQRAIELINQINHELRHYHRKLTNELNCSLKWNREARRLFYPNQNGTQLIDVACNITASPITHPESKTAHNTNLQKLAMKFQYADTIKTILENQQISAPNRIEQAKQILTDGHINDIKELRGSSFWIWLLKKLGIVSRGERFIRFFSEREQKHTNDFRQSQENLTDINLRISQLP